MHNMRQMEEYNLYQTQIVMKPLNSDYCTECTFLLQHGIGVSSLIDYLVGPQSCENKNLDVILSHNHCLPWILLQSWYKNIHIDKMKKIWQGFMEKAVFLLLSRCQPWDAVQISALFKLCW